MKVINYNLYTYKFVYVKTVWSDTPTTIEFIPVSIVGFRLVSINGTQIAAKASFCKCDKRPK